MQYETLEPNPYAIVDSLRSIGYTFETAVADLIDNSITAGANQVDIDCVFDDCPKLFILDNGTGMDEGVLHKAMKLGGDGPSAERSSSDLGRFGLGLKTASFSQCKKLTVISKTKNGICQRCWDIDIIKERGWSIDKSLNAEYSAILDKYKTGTLVVWEKMDTLFQTIGEKSESLFAAKNEALRSHLGLTFHRFIEDGRLSIRTGGAEVYAWDPFLPDVPVVQKIMGVRDEIAPNVFVEYVVLPHRSYFTDASYKKAGHVKGWNQMQGFYIYRNDRLLAIAGWLGLREAGRLMKRDRFYDLARIRIDISNENDQKWNIDIKKSQASCPDVLVDTLSNIATKVRKTAYEVYKNRNYINIVKRTKGEVVILWNTDVSSGNLRLDLNPDFPLLKDFVATLDPAQLKKFNKILKVVSDTVPTDKICFELGGSEPRQMEDPLADCDFDDYTKDLVVSYMNYGYSKEDAIQLIKQLLNIQ